jgi:1-deoxy-D-xylulose-5-phosphate reductoisomerase
LRVKQQSIVVLGSTGSVGVSTLDVVARHRDRYRVVALTANRRADALFSQCVVFRPRFAVLNDGEAAEHLSRRLRGAGLETQVLAGGAELERVVALPEVDSVMAAIVGIAGLRATHAAACAGKRVLLANKEALVSAGAVFMRAVARHRATLIPIDSEHNAVFQALPPGSHRELERAGVRRILLTASGGPFRTVSPERLARVTPDEACAHPNWVMGRKISVDSATMMNKGLEIIEAAWLFNATDAQITVVIHPESVIHSLVEYIDGSVIAQLGNPDMRTPIAFALGYPERIEAGVKSLDLAAIGRLHFSEPDDTRFPCLALARRALRAGGNAATLLNAANEIAVEAFLAGRLAFNAIPAVIERVLNEAISTPAASLDEVFAADLHGRVCAREWLERQGASKRAQPARVSAAQGAQG